MKRILLSIVALLLTTLYSSAQISKADVYFYVKSGDSGSTQVYVVEFNGSYIKALETTISTVRSKLSNNYSHYSDYFINQGKESNYDYDLSTSKREVYKSGYDATMYFDPILGAPVTSFRSWQFFAFSLDISSMIRWEEVKSSGQMKNKVYYKRVDRSYFFPEDDPGRYDFLN